MTGGRSKLVRIGGHGLWQVASSTKGPHADPPHHRTQLQLVLDGNTDA